MSLDSDDEKDLLENVAEVMDSLSKELQELYSFRDLFFENHSIEMAKDKNKLVEEKKDLLIEKFEAIDVDSQIPFLQRAQFLYMKGRCYNICTTYDSRATQCLSKAVKLNPHLVDAWNELGECYWKNMNVKDAKASFEGALKHERNRLSLRCLSIILRQESGDKKRAEMTAAILKSVELAKEAVAQDIKDGVSWMVLGNAYLCQFFTVAQDPATLKLCMSAYKQAWLDPIAKGQPDLYYNKGIALKYEELYEEALQDFEYACQLDPVWEPPRAELVRLRRYLAGTDELVRTRGRVKAKKLAQMVQCMEDKLGGAYLSGPQPLQRCTLDELREGRNEGALLLARVVGSIHTDTNVPFTFAVTDESSRCAAVTVYNWAAGRGVLAGDCVALPRPELRAHAHRSPLAKYEFKSIRVNNPTLLLVNGKRVGRDQVASTRVTSTYEIH